MSRSKKNSIIPAVLYVKKHPQVLFALMLLFVIPLLFLYTGQQFLEVGKSNQERLQKDKVGIMHDVLVSLLQATEFNLPVAATELAHLVEQNPDIIDYKISREEGGVVTPLLALATTSIGVPETNLELYSNASLRKDESLIFEYTESGDRVWAAYRALRAPTGELYFVYTKISLAHVDALLASREYEAYVRLLFVYIFLVLLAWWHIKLTDYRYLYNEAQKAIETKDLFTHTLAHELRAPLTAIRGYASLLKEHLPVSTQHEQAARIEQSSERLITIVNDLLDIARLQSGKLEITKAEHDITNIITVVTREFAVAAKSKGCELIWNEDTVPGIIFADAKRVEQIMTNIISNAVKYTSSGTITVTTTPHRGKIEVRVKDTGAGISADDQKKLFAPFFRTESAESSSTTGTGLGMWITRELIELMGGSIGVESMQGVGTQIVMMFPVKV